MATREELKQVFANGQMATGEKFANLIDSMKVVQLPVVDPQALGTSLSFIDSISQDADGKITVTKKTVMPTVGSFRFVANDATAEAAFTAVGAKYSGAISGVSPSADTLGVILLMNDDDTTPTKTMMITTEEVTPATNPATYQFVYVGDLSSALPSGVLTEDDVDDTHLVNPASNALAKAGDVQTIGQKLKGIELYEDKVSPVSVVAGKFLKPNNTEESNANWSYASFNCIGYDGVRFLGQENINVDSAAGFCFLDSENEVVGGGNYGHNPQNTAIVKTDLTVKVPETAVVFKTNIKTNAFSDTEFYCYMQKGSSVIQQIEMYEEVVPAEVGKYVYKNGTVLSGSSFGMTAPIHLSKGNVIEVFTKSSDLGVISTTDETGSSYTPVSTSPTPGVFTTYRYTAQNDVYVCASVNITKAYFIRVFRGESIRNKVQTLDKAVALLSGKTDETIKVELVLCRMSTYNPFFTLAYDDAYFGKYYIQPDYLICYKGDVFHFAERTGESVHVIFYDNLFNGLSNTAVVDNTITVPDNAHYCRIAIYKDDGYYSASYRNETFSRQGMYVHEFAKRIILPTEGSNYMVRGATFPVEMPPLNEASDGGRDYNAYGSTTPPVFTNSTILIRRDMYNAVGRPMKICLFFNGTDGYVFHQIDNLDTYSLTRLLADSGYAVISVSSQTNKGVNQSSEGWASRTDCNWSDPITMACCKAALEYYVREYNLATDGIYIACKSAGGLMSAVTSQIGSFKVKAAGLIAPALDYMTYYKILAYTKDCSSSLRRLGVENGTVHGTQDGGVSNEDLEGIVSNIDKIIPWNPIFHNTIGFDFEAYIRQVKATGMMSLETNQTLMSIVNAATKNVTVPMKIWHAVDDENVPIATSRFFAGMVRRGGGICILREFPANSGKHAINAMDNADTPKITYTTKYGESFENTPVANAELCDWLNRW